MDEANRKLEAERRVAEVDAQTESPDQRAEKVLNILKQHAPDLSNWDLICFAANYLMFSSQAYEWLRPHIEQALRYVFSAHYYKTDELGLLAKTKPKIISLDEWRNGK